MTSTHEAALAVEKGAKLKIETRPTPVPGPNEVLVAVKAIALNPVDHFRRDYGHFIKCYPAVLGSDIAGTIVAVGSKVDGLQCGMRVLACAESFKNGGLPDYGAFQSRVLVESTLVAEIPDHLGFAGAAALPLATVVAWSGLWKLGFTPAVLDTLPRKPAILLVGASGSVGSNTLQVLARLGFSVYATASAKHHTYLASLCGAHARVQFFDYTSPTLADEIATAAQTNADEMSLAFIASGWDADAAIADAVKVLNRTKRTGAFVQIACALRLLETTKWDGGEAVFVTPPSDEDVCREFQGFVFGKWLKEKTESKEHLPSPMVKVVPGGLSKINEALDDLKAGVSGVKIVLEI
ncbi:hypothetical protein HDU83_004092 [Entophlyctis luteolus]|nr:hypothetical protein HDU83_004092 [Entophlyctis luteolus]